MKTLKSLLFLWLAGFFFTAFSVFADEPSACRIQMLWSPQAQFAGFYAAQAEGFYKEAGLNVEILHSSITNDPLEALEEGRTDFAVAWALSALIQRSQGKDFVNIAQLQQSTALLFIARKDSGIASVSDFTGRRIGLWMSPAYQLALTEYLAYHHIDSYEPIYTIANIDLFLYNGVDLTCAMRYNEYCQMIMAGINPEELVVFDLKDTFPFMVDDGLYTMSETYRNNPEMAKKVREATLKGWKRAFEDKEKTLELVRQECKNANVPFNLATQRWMLNEMEKLIQPAANDGFLRYESFDQLRKMLKLKEDAIRFEDFAPDAPGKEER